MTISIISQILSWGAMVIALSAILLSLVYNTRQSKKIAALELLLKDVLKSRDSLKKQIGELHTGAVGVGNKICELDRSLKETNERQQDIVTMDPENKLYSRAVKMVELGAGLDELIAECELPKAEAELLLNLHARKKSI